MRKLTLLIALLFFLPGCYIINTVHINVYPDDGISILFRSAGDSADVFDTDFPHPALTGPFVRETGKEFDEEGEPYWVMTTRGFLKEDHQFNFEGDRSIMSPIGYIRNEGWVSTHYNFSQGFYGFGLSSKYPSFIDAYTNNVLEDTLIWLPEFHNYSIRAALSDLSEDMEELQVPGMVDRLANHVSNYFNYIESKNKSLMPARPALNDLRQLFNPFLNELPPSFIVSLNLALIPYQEELSQVIDLKGEIIEYSLLMPGTLLTSNADSTSGDTLFWTIDTETLLNEPRVVSAHSITFKKDNLRTALGISAGILLVGILLILGFRRRNK